MNKTIYFACSYQNRANYLPLINSLKELLKPKEWVITAPVFDLAHISVDQLKQIMDTSFNYLSKSQLLIAEASEKNIGVGIEIGYAKALNIPIIYLYKESSEFSTTVSGTANHTVCYISQEDALREIDKITNDIS